MKSFGTRDCTANLWSHWQDKRKNESGLKQANKLYGQSKEELGLWSGRKRSSQRSPDEGSYEIW